MYNLIQIQDALKGMTPDQVMKYVNGTNPEVPSYLALSELNRRKQLQDTAAEFYGQPTTVKDQITSSLTQAPQGVNPAAAPAQVNPTAVPPQLAVQQPPPTQAPAPQMPAQVNPTAAPPQFARGGLSTLPVGMFKQSNYAGGGIVAFEEGGQPSLEQRLQMLQDKRGDELPRYKDPMSSILERYQPRVPDSQYEEQGKNAYVSKPIEQEKPKSEPNKVPENPNVQASNTSSGRLPNTVAVERLSEKTTPSGQPLTDEQLFERRKALEKLAGVSEDPYADIKKRYGDIEATRKEQQQGDAWDALIYRLGTLSQGKNISFGANMGESAVKTATFEKEQAALRDKQANDMAGLQKEVIKEDDSRKRGDVKGVEDARAAQEKYKMDLAELEVKRQNASANMMQATRPTTFEQQTNLARTNPDLFKLIQGQGKAGLMTLEEALKTVMADPMSATLTDEQKRQKAREIYNWANGQQNAPQNAPTVTTKAEFDKLPSGAIYTSTDGKQYRKP